jgi:chain length determinant protein tyrosine kinase EpsG
MRVRATPTAPPAAPRPGAPGGQPGSLGMLLVESGTISPEQAEQIARQQRETGARYGDVAVELGFATEADIQTALARQFSFDIFKPGDPRIDPQVIAAFEPEHHTSLLIRSLRSQILLRWPADAAGQSFALTSAARGEGRSFLAANLAVVFAQLGARTLLVDADLRHPVQHELFRVAGRAGLSTILSGRTAATGYEQATALPRLSILPAGPIPPNPEELLSQEEFATLVRQMRGSYDVIIFDTPADAEGADAQLIGAKVGSVLLAARKHKAKVSATKTFAEQLTVKGATILGTVLNEVPRDALARG